MRCDWKRLLLLALFLTCLPLPAFGNQEEPGPALARLMADLRAEAAKGRTIAYREEKHYAFLEQDLKSSGFLSFRPPDTLIREVLTPEPARYIIKGPRLIMEEEGRPRREINLGDYPQAAAFIEALRAVLAGDLPALERHFQVTLRSGHIRWTLQLIPRDPQMGKVVEAISLTGRGGQVGEVRTSEAGGDYTLMVLSREADQ